MIVIRVVNRLAGFGMSFLGLRLAAGAHLELNIVALVLALFGVSTIASRLLGGALALRVGTRASMVTGLTACGLAQLTIGFANATTVLVAAVVLLGLSYELIEPATQVVIAAGSARDQLAAGFALLWAATSIAGVVSGLLVVVLTPFGVPALFLVDGLSSLLAAALALRMCPTRRPCRAPTTRSRLRDAATPRLLAWTGIGTGYATLAMIVVLMLPLAVRAAGQPRWLTGAVLAAGAASALVAQRGLRRWGSRVATRPVLALGHLLLAAGTGLWTLPHPAAYLLGAVFEGASGSLLIGTYQATAARLNEPGLGAATMAIFGLCWGVATTAAPLIGGQLLSYGPVMLWGSVAAASLGAAALALVPNRCIADPDRSAATVDGVRTVPGQRPAVAPTNPVRLLPSDATAAVSSGSS
ncbi:MAG TPA: MFS transporter [Jatrophihabitans sp.]